MLKVRETQSNPDAGRSILDMIANGEIDLMINTPFGHETRGDGYELRLAAVCHGVPYATTLSGAQALAQAMEVVRATGLNIVALQDFDQWA